MHSSKIQQSHQLLISVGFSSKDMMCPVTWSLLLSPQGLLVTNGVTETKPMISFKVSSKQVKQTNNVEQRPPQRFSPFPQFSEASKEDKSHIVQFPTLSCAVLDYGRFLLSYWLWEDGPFFSWISPMAPTASRLEAQSSLEATCGLIWTDALKQIPGFPSGLLSWQAATTHIEGWCPVLANMGALRV